LFKADISPVWLGVMMGLNLQTSFLTPPFGWALFYMRGVAPPTVKTSAIYRGIIPFVALQLAALALLWTYPPLATWLPDQLLR
jgi:TRAP-type mannitol/chloroaromatic compound transport system permease large subunit